MAVAHQFLVITDSELEPSDDFLMDLAYKLLGAERPRNWLGWMGSRLGYSFMNFERFQRAFESKEVFVSEFSPVERGVFLDSFKQFILFMLRSLYSQNPQKILPNTLILDSDDSRLNQWSCSDSSFVANTFYARHPADSNYFLRVADFHSYLLQDKRAEFVRLASSLGAREIKLADTQEKDKSSLVNVAVDSLGGKNFNTSLDIKNQSSSSFDLSASFSVAESLPLLPDKLRWFKYEPLWQAMAEARINHWVERFQVRFTYSQDFSINTELVAKISGLGLSIGGTFFNMQRIDQEYIVDFFPRSTYSH